ncbi:MAG TPA: Maf family protein [Anaerolineales bacterium]|nr:Maf family protein [Anaerolineales bacterium]
MLILASNSPRRRQLLALGGWAFRVAAVEIDEGPLPAENPLAYVLRLAESKARAAAARSDPEAIILAADTAVADGERILGKPKDAAEAERMLRSLRGRSHQVFTALAVYRPSTGTLLTDWCLSEVPMRAYSDEEMQAYIASGDPLDKAGAYAIQHAGFKPVAELSACYANVMGLPLCHLSRTLAKLGFPLDAGIAQACQAALAYQCPVYQQVLGAEVQRT